MMILILTSQAVQYLVWEMFYESAARIDIIQDYK